MDADLAFCLGRFIDDQVQIIDDRIGEIEREEISQCEKLIVEKKKIPRVKQNKGSHRDDQVLVDEFIQELRDKGAVKEKKTIIDDETCIATLRAEASTKINATSKYISRLRNSARVFPNTANFMQLCKDTIDYFDSLQEFEKNFQDLMIVLKETDGNNVQQNVQNWWRDAYGSRIADVNNRNNKFNQAGTEKNYVTLSQTNRIIDNAKKLIAARTVIFVESPKLDIIKKFVHKLLILDETKRAETNAEELINRLNQLTVDEMMNYASEWLDKRDQNRNEKEEPDQYEIKIAEIKAEFGRQKIAQQAKKLALAALLCRLAVGSSNGEQFDKQLKATVSKQKDSSQSSFPVISGEIKKPDVQELPVIVQLELDRVDMNRWENNIDGIREQFASGLCQAFLIPTKSIRVENIDRNKGIIFLFVKPPYGKQVVDCLNGGATDAVARMLAVRKCCRDMDAPIESMTLGEFGLKIEDQLMDPRWNKIYGWKDDQAKGEHYWPSPIMQGGRPYYCPSGWKRFSIKVAEDDKEFDARWGNWYMAYHGTRGENASKILTSGLKVSTNGCFYNDGEPRVYVSPSIEYCAHPRYAYPWKQTKRNGEVCWYQLVFQCRVNPASITNDSIHPETLIRNEYKKIVQVDPNFSNNELEWIIIGKPGEEFITKEIICYGLMLRITNVDPQTLTPSHWWKSSHHADIYKK